MFQTSHGFLYPQRYTPCNHTKGEVMEQRTYHGDLNPEDIAKALVAQFNQGSTVAHQFSQGERVVVQIGSRDRRQGVENALTVSLSKTRDGVNVGVGEQRWLDAATDLAQAGLGALFNPVSLISNLGEIVRDVSSFSLPEQVWKTIESYCDSVGAGLGGSLEQSNITCGYCGVLNEPGAPRCIACGAPMGNLQPIHCHVCGLSAPYNAKTCKRCGAKLAPRG